MQHRTVEVPVGYRVGGWRVEQALACGSWSSVYVAERVEPDDDVPQRAALKFIPTGTLTSRQLSHLADMATRELAVHRSVHHPGLVRVLDTLVIDDPAHPALDGGTVLAMELAVESAAAALGRAGGAGLPDAPRIIAEVCAALAHLHRAGWVHGDLKPSNVLLMPDGSVRLADFGLAAEMDGTHAYLPPGGTSDYVPPERWAEPVQAHGAAVRQTADVWALGVTACQLLTGELPFSGVTSRARVAAAAAYAAGRHPLSLPAGLDDAWRQFIIACLAPDHATRERYDAATLQLQAEQILSAHRSRRGVDLLRRRGARRAAAAVTIGALAVAGVTAAVAWWPQKSVARTGQQPAYARYFRTDADIPSAYYDLIVAAGTSCPENKAVTPLLVAALLKTESNFDPNLADPINDEYGIARWTPSVLAFYLPPEPGKKKVPVPPFPPQMSIPAVGKYLCRMAPELDGLPGSPAENLAAGYRTSAEVVLAANGVPQDRPKVIAYIARLRQNLQRYEPAAAAHS